MSPPYGLKKPKKVKSPTGRPSKKKDMKLTGGKRPTKAKPKKKPKKAGLSAFGAAENLRKSATRAKKI